MNVVITIADIIKKKGKEIEYRQFHSSTECPLAIAMSRLLNQKVNVLTQTISDKNWNQLGSISPAFDYRMYSELRCGKIKQFKAVYTPLIP